MYREYFGLKDNPFSISPDPHYFYMSRGHREALAHLVYGINNDGGFILLTGEVGTGKTTVCRCLLELIPENADIAFILNPNLTVEELLASICDELGVKYPKGNKSKKVFVAAINDYLFDVHDKGRRVILILEEAQNLAVDVLEQIRLLTNLETNKRKLLQIIMLGQPELKELLSRPQLRQLSQRITARYHLSPLTEEEVVSYVERRLAVAGLVRSNPFPKDVLKRLFKLTGGIPRLINVICDRALVGAFVQGKDKVDRKTIDTAAKEVSGVEVRSRGRKTLKRYALWAAVALLFLVQAGFTATYLWKEAAAGKAARVAAEKAAREVVRKVPVAPPKTATLDVPDDAAGSLLRDHAWQALFTLWEAKYESGSRRSPCEQARDQGLQCLEEKGSLPGLGQLNKPAILKLVKGGGGEYYGTITSLKGDAAVVVIGQETRTVDIKEMARRWSGDYTLLWRPPKGFKGELLPGRKGAVVTWLGEQLALAQGVALKKERTLTYDEELAGRVKEFQSLSGLNPDGIVGTKTAICLADAAGTGGPVLRVREKGTKKNVVYP